MNQDASCIFYKKLSQEAINSAINTASKIVEAVIQGKSDKDIKKLLPESSEDCFKEGVMLGVSVIKEAFNRPLRLFDGKLYLSTGDVGSVGVICVRRLISAIFSEQAALALALVMLFYADSDNACPVITIRGGNRVDKLLSIYTGNIGIDIDYEFTLTEERDPMRHGQLYTGSRLIKVLVMRDGSLIKGIQCRAKLMALDILSNSKQSAKQVIMSMIRY